MHVILLTFDPFVPPLHQPVYVEEEEREGQQEGRGRSFGQLGGKAER